MDANEFIKLRKKMEDDHKANVTALETMWKWHNGNLPIPTLGTLNFQTTIFDDYEVDTTQPLSVSSIVKELLPSMPHTFSVKNFYRPVEKRLGKKVHNNQVSTALTKLRKKEVIEVVDQGGGSTPPTYKLKQTRNN